jgi:hypothetical protein
VTDLKERAQFFRNPGDRVSDRRRSKLAISTFIQPASGGGKKCAN